MSTSYDDLVTAMMREIRGFIINNTDRVLHGTWLAAEAEDANLSKIDIEGIEVRWAQKCEHVTGLTENDQVLCLKGPGTPVTIIGVVTGDIRLAQLSIEE
jgi:hypothetical protein